MLTLFEDLVEGAVLEPEILETPTSGRKALLTGPEQAPPPCTYTFLTSPADMALVYRKLGSIPLLEIDLEFNHRNPWLADPLLWQVSDGRHYFVADAQKVPLRELAPLIAGKTLLAHNAVTEYKMLRIHGVEHLSWICPMIAYQVAKSGLLGDEDEDGGKTDFKSASLQTLVDQYLGIYLPKEEQSSFLGMQPGTPFTESQLQYAATDVRFLHTLWEQLRAELVDKSLLNTALFEFSLIPCFGDMELCGFRTDTKSWRSHLKDMTSQMLEKEAAIRPLVQPYYDTVLHKQGKRLWTDDDAPVQLGFGFDALFEDDTQKEQVADTRAKTRAKFVDGEINLGSSKQLLEVYSEMGIELPDTRRKTFQDLLLKLSSESEAYAITDGLVTLKSYHKLLDAFGEKMLAVIEAHPSHTVWTNTFQCGATSTGRASSGTPINMQQIPARGKLGGTFRNFFIAQKNTKLIIADYSSLEQRIVAHLSKDPTMLRIFADGLDMHTVAASNIFDLPYEEFERAGKYDRKTGEYERKDAGWEPGLKLWTRSIHEDPEDLKSPIIEWEDALTGAALPDYKPTSDRKTIKFMRDEITKTCSFATNYGGGPSTIQETLHMPIEWCKTIYDRYVDTYKGVFTYGDKMSNLALVAGYTATVGGRKRFYRPTQWEHPDLFPSPVKQHRELLKRVGSPPTQVEWDAFKALPMKQKQKALKERAKAHALWPSDVQSIEDANQHRTKRQGRNQPVQGSAADITKLAMLKVWLSLREQGLLKVFGPDGRYVGAEHGACIILQVHDEIITQADSPLAKSVKGIVEEAMLSAERELIPGVVPGISCHIGTRWSEK